MRHKNGQSSVEYILLVGVIIVVAIPLFFYGLSKTKDDLRINQLDDAVISMAKTADSVYALGLGSKDVIVVDIPKGVKTASASGKTLELTMGVYGSDSDFVRTSVANLVFALGFDSKIIQEGRHHVLVDTFKDTVDGKIKVLLGGYCEDDICTSTENSIDCPDDCAPQCGDGVCNFPDVLVGGVAYKEFCNIDNSAVPGTKEFCSVAEGGDCFGSQVECDSGKVCAKIDGDDTKGQCVTGNFCGDGRCAYPVLENCNICPKDCLPGYDPDNPGGPDEWRCCPDPTVSGSYYPEDPTLSPPCDIPPTVSNCADWCVFIAFKQGKTFNTGLCAQTASKCDDNDPNGEWVQVDTKDIDGTPGGHPVCGVGGFDNECDGDEFCIAGAQANLCCCETR